MRLLSRRRANGLRPSSEDGGLCGACMVGGSEGTAPGQKGLTDPVGLLGWTPLPVVSIKATAQGVADALTTRVVGSHAAR